MAYQSDDLIAAVKRDSYLPTAQTNFTASQLLAIADEQIFQHIAPQLVSLDEGFYREQAPDATMTSGTGNYTLPQYAMWTKIFQVHMVNSSGNTIPLRRIDPSELRFFNTNTTGTPVYHYLDSDQLQLVPAPDSNSASSYSLRYWIYRRPGRLVRATTSGTDTKGAAQVLSVAGGVVTYTAAPPASFTSSSSHDFYSGNAPFKRMATNITASAQAGSTQTFPSASAALLVAGDWVNLKDETTFPGMPLELQPFLKDLVIASLARTQMDMEAYGVLRDAILENMRTTYQAGPGSRMVGQPKKLTLLGHGLLANHIWRRRIL